MARITQATLNAYKALDILLWVQLRGSLSEAEVEWFYHFDESLQKELESTLITKAQKPYLEHYVLCICQIRLWSAQGKESLTSGRLEGLSEQFKKIAPDSVMSYEQIKQHISDMELSNYIATAKTCMKRQGIHLDTVLTISDSLLKNQKLNISHISREQFIDLSVQYYIFKEPKCAIYLLTYFCSLGILKNKGVSSTDKHIKRGYEALARVGLFQEFYHLCIFMEQHNTDFWIEKKHVDIEDLFDPREKRVELKNYSIPASYFKTRPGRRVLECLADENRSKKIHMLPIIDYKKRSEVERLLKYAIQDYELQLLQNPENQKPYQLRKISSITFGAVLHHSLFSYFFDDLPFCRGDGSDTVTKTTQFAKILKEQHGITISWKTLYNSYCELKSSNGQVERLRKEWQWFLFVAANGLQPWYEPQRELIDIPGLIKLCETEQMS